MPAQPFVTIIVPTLNEERYIARAIDSLIAGLEDVAYELIVLDGGSTDRTTTIVAQLAASNPRIRLEANPQRYQSAAVNRGAMIAHPESEIILRADSHAEYPPSFVAGLIRELREREAGSVVVPMRTRGTAFIQRGIAAAQNSRFGNGGALHRIGTTSRYVEHGHHAAFLRKTFLAVGGYDESFTHNEDAELDIRLRKSGAKLWLCSELAVTYFPRSSFGSLARQYFNHGSGRAKTMLKHRQQPKLRQMLPLGALGMNVTGIALSCVFGGLFLLPSALYAGGCLAAGAWLAVVNRDVAGCAAGPAAMIMHQSWAAGFGYRVLRSWRSRTARIKVERRALP
ncbi:glycosyltransferase family 2 protein [Bradyrhizobium sp. HKCCYLS20291]|uniref:glycosyltransferase family 2 protein n=1 Tax=Bradyrhizobium sp. HKCCYLS20291 TaxID=3420766 RepID=UPI003EBC9FB5